METITTESCARGLRQLKASCPKDVEPHLVIGLTDRRLVDSDLFSADDGGLPSIHPGSRGTGRISLLDGHDGLHLAVNDYTVEIHLDRIDARRFRFRHLIDATRVLEGAVTGTAAGRLHSRRFAILGAALGALVGAFVPCRRPEYFVIRPNGAIERTTPLERVRAARDCAFVRRFA